MCVSLQLMHSYHQCMFEDQLSRILAIVYFPGKFLLMKQVIIFPAHDFSG